LSPRKPDEIEGWEGGREKGAETNLADISDFIENTEESFQLDLKIAMSSELSVKDLIPNTKGASRFRHRQGVKGTRYMLHCVVG